MQISMKKNIQSTAMILCLAICFSLFGCSDKDNVNPELLEITTDSVSYSDGWNFKIQVDKLGNIPVVEHGILHLSFFRNSSDRDYVPRIEHGARMKFEKPLVAGTNTYNYKGDAFAGKYFYYYRAYAIKSDGSVVYGEARNYTFPQLQDL